jgi:hypothetical protein
MSIDAHFSRYPNESDGPPDGELWVYTLRSDSEHFDRAVHVGAWAAPTERADTRTHVIRAARAELEHAGSVRALEGRGEPLTLYARPS